MATGQVALTRHRTPVNHASRPSRTVVPAFLQKLFEMVNDPNNVDLIRWSDAGDTFFVLDHERFAREVLGRWFKHQNFSSFVRQLNMYGFHKIPHLQQGVLRSETDTEFWNFAHPHFHRGQPDLLCLIQRKKQVAQPGDDISMDIRDHSTSNPTSNAPLPANLSSGQLLDIHSIVNGIAAIKRHQTTISSELNELKRSNQMLWQDAMDARAKHQKQQDTINRIVKFLAGVFGNRATPHKEDVVESAPHAHVAVVPRRRPRFMIEDGRRKEKVDVSELLQGDGYEYNETPTPEETPQSAPSPAPSTVSSTTSEPSTQFGTHHPLHFPIPPEGYSPQLPIHQLPESEQRPLPDAERSVTPSRSPTNFDFDPRVQNVLNQLTPLQIQQLLASLATQTIDPIQPSAAPASSSQLTSYQPHFDYAQFLQPASPSPQPPVEGLISFDNSSETAGRIDKQWKAAEDIDKDVNAVNTRINALIQNLGLDPQQLINVPPPNPDSTPQPDDQTDPSIINAPHVLDDTAGPAAQDFDFDSFLNTFGTNDQVDYEDSASTAFLDDMPPDGTASPIAHLAGSSPQMRTQKSYGGAKRKSNASDFDSEERQENTLSGSKSPKRRRDK